MKHIMVATDGSEGAIRAVDTAARLARAVGGDLVILHVEGEGNVLHDAERLVPQIAGDVLDTHARRILSVARDQALAAGVSGVRTEAAWGDAADVIIDRAGRNQLDAVVVGRRGRGRLSGLLLGSVSQKVACLATCLVLIVP